MHLCMYICIYKYLADIAYTFSSTSRWKSSSDFTSTSSFVPLVGKKFSLMVSMKGCCCCLFELDVFTCKDVVDVDIDDDDDDDDVEKR